MDQKYHVDNRSNIFVRYASTPDGDDFSDRPDVTRPYIGILATGYRYDSPIREDFKGLWQEYRGRPGTSAEVHIDPITYTWVINGVDTGVVALAHDTAMAKSYCNGQTGLRDNEERDNAMFYKQAAESASSLAEESLNEVKEVLRQIKSQNEVIQGHISEATDLNDAMTGKVEHVDMVVAHVDHVASHVDEVDTQLTAKYQEVVLNTQAVSENKDLVISIRTQIQGYVSTAEQYANQTSTDKTVASAAADRAGEARDDAQSYSKEAKSYARGGTGTRTGEDTDNGLYYLTETRGVAVTVGEDKATVQAAQQDVTTKAGQVTLDTQQVSQDKIDITGMKNTVVEKHGEVVTLNGTVAQNAHQVANDVITVTGLKQDVLDEKATIVTLAGSVQDAYTYITTSTQVSTFTIDATGHLIENRVGATIFTFSVDASGHLIVTDANNSSSTVDLGIVSAYGEARDGGYTGTYAQFKADVVRALTQSGEVVSVTSTTDAAVITAPGKVYNVDARYASGLIVTLPDPADCVAAGIPCEVDITIKFTSTTTLTIFPRESKTYAYEGGASAPTLHAGDIYRYVARWSALADKWIITATAQVLA